MTKDEELLNEIIQRRGYIVAGSSHERKLGESVVFPSSPRALFYVIADTDATDIDEQARLIRRLSPDRSPADSRRGKYFYRVLSD